MKRLLAAAAVVLLIATGCTGTERWQERGFPSEEACYRHHGYTSGSISTSDFGRYEYWCGPIEDG